MQVIRFHLYFIIFFPVPNVAPCAKYDQNITITVNDCSAQVLGTLCAGTCASDSLLNINGLGFAQECACCAPDMDTVYSSTVMLRCGKRLIIKK